MFSTVRMESSPVNQPSMLSSSAVTSQLWLSKFLFCFPTAHQYLLNKILSLLIFDVANICAYTFSTLKCIFCLFSVLQLLKLCHQRTHFTHFCCTLYRRLNVSVFLCRRIGKDLSNTFAKLEKLTICKCSVNTLD